MKVLFRSRDSRSVRSQQRAIERLRQALRYPNLQGVVAADRPSEALAWIPIRAAQPHVTRQRHQRTLRDRQPRRTPANS